MSEANQGSWLRRLFTTDAQWVDPIEKKQFGGTDGHGLDLVSFSPRFVDHVVGREPDGWPIYDEGPGAYGSIYRKIPAVSTVTDFLSSQIAQIGIKMYQRVSPDERRELSDHPVENMLHHPAPGYTYARWMQRAVADLCIYGNAFWLKEEAGRDRWLVPVPPEFVSIRGGDILGANTYIVSVNGSPPREYPADRFVHLRRYNPTDPRWGVSPLEPLRAVIAEESAASAHRRAFWENAARFEFALRTDGQLSDTAISRLRQDISNTYSGTRNAGKIAIFEEGLDVKELSFSPKDAEFIEGRRLVLETVLRAFHVPLALFGLAKTATYASAREAAKDFIRNAIAPWTRSIEGDINLSVVPWFDPNDDAYAEFTIEEKLRGSFEEQADQLTKAIGGPWMAPDEGRALFNLPPIEGGEGLLTGGGGVQPSELPAEGESAPVERAAIEAILRKFFERQERVLSARIGGLKSHQAIAIEAFWDSERWDSELATDLEPFVSDYADQARKINQVTYEALLDAPDDIAGVLLHARDVRVSDIAWRLTSQE